jgi:hypothetical protein
LQATGLRKWRLKSGMHTDILLQKIAPVENQDVPASLKSGMHAGCFSLRAGCRFVQKNPARPLMPPWGSISSPVGPGRVWTMKAHQGRDSPMWKKPPLGPSSSRVARATPVLAPSTVSMGASQPPRSVLTQPGWAEFTLIGVFLRRAAR